MPVDASVYSSIKPIPINIPSPLDTAEKAMSLSQLGLQQMQMARQLQTQSAIQSAYAHNTDPETGELNQGGYLSDLGKMNPMAAQQETSRIAAQNKATAEASAAKADAANKALTIVGPAFDVMAGMPEDQRAAAYDGYVKQIKSQGVDVTPIDHPYDKGLFSQYYANWQKSKPALENQAIQATTAETQAKTALTQAEVPTAMATNQAKLAGEQFGSRSPNATLSDEYNKQAAPLRASASAMNQMMDNYKNQTPQGDASLILNAFKIKFPNAPDVNSLDELSKSQAAPDQFKQMAAHALSGGLDQSTRDNLMRDGISTFRANSQTLQGIQQKTQLRQNFQGVNDPTMTAEPTMDQTLKDATDFQKQLGPYVPPSQRGGVMAGLSGIASKVLGVGGDQSAKAQDDKTQSASQYRPSGAKVSADEVAQYAMKHGQSFSAAQAFLKGKGYVIGR